MPSRKRPLEDVDTEESTSLTDMLSRIRNTWQFANLMQYIYLFGNALKIDNELDVEVRLCNARAKTCTEAYIATAA